MSVSTLPTLHMKRSEKPEKISDILAVNNNIKDLKIDERLTETVSHGSLNNVKGQTDSIKDEKVEVSPELSDDTTSDSPSCDVSTSEASARVYESDDITFDDELAAVARSNSVDYLKEKAIIMLQQELDHARKELELKDEKCKELSSVRTKVEEELEELTASLFQEAHKMVHDANMKHYIAEKRLNEATGEIEALRTEISALKSLVLTSTPSNPNPQLHPQLIKKKKDVLGSPLLRKHRKSRSDTCDKKSQQPKPVEQKAIVKMGKEIDSVIMQHLSDWLKTTYLTSRPAVNHTTPSQSELSTSISNDHAQIDGAYHAIQYEKMAPVTSQFLQKIEAEDVNPCLTFTQASLAQKVSESVHYNTLTIEPLSKPSMHKCALSEVSICCKHQIKFGDSEKWLPISQSCRTRIASVCDYLTYIRYIEQGLVKHSKEQMYWEINRLRREMSLAKLGYYKEE